MTNRYSLNTRLAAGLLAGMIAGAVMGLTAMVRASALGLGFFFPMDLIAGTIWGTRALIADPGMQAVGILIHMAVAGAGGMLFAGVFANLVDAGAALVGGIAWGIGIWAANTWIFLPWLDPVMLQRQMVAPLWWLVFHLIYGAMLVLVPAVAAALARSRPQGVTPGLGTAAPAAT